MTTPLVILGCGYVGSHIARAALAAGRPVRVCRRSTGKIAALGELGAQIKYLDASQPKQLTQVLASSQGGTAVYAMSRVGGPPGHIIRAALQAAYGGGISTFVYLSSSGLYGDGPDDETWIDEETPVVHGDQEMAHVLSDERELEICSFDRVRTIALRLAPVYGPGKGVRERLKKGEYRLLDDGQHAISRIHIDDVARVVFAAEEKAPPKSTYLVADDEPTTQLAYATWLCDRMGLPLPEKRSMFEPGGRKVSFRNRRIRNAKLKRELEIELAYPTFREGEAMIEAAISE
ncbi:MAG: NAD-dependent epimerase/dehydratase family protein [Myxococcota bacterium]|nr:NAD-dependent epimerase/dehydratase family protein [Myxococcota bacterium]